MTLRCSDSVTKIVKKLTDEMLFLKIEIKNSRRQFNYVKELMSKHTEK